MKSLRSISISKEPDDAHEGSLSGIVHSNWNPDRYRYSYRVQFDKSVAVSPNWLFNQEPFHCLINNWLKANCGGRHGVGGDFVLFENEQDAMLCHMAFCGTERKKDGNAR